jgi:uncharacterized membrane protein YbhN (UPF0104 family)
MTRMQTVQSIIFALFLVLGSVFCLYYDVFYLWMLAYKPQYKSIWDHRLYASLAATLLFGISWISFTVWQFQMKRSARTGPPLQ